MKKLLFAALVIVMVSSLAGTSSAFGTGGVKKKRPLPYNYGLVIINNYSEKAWIAPVVFDHWLHRAFHTCRVCHVDIGFAMKAGDTNIRADDNINGYYCGACHNGKMKVGDKVLFASCSKTPLREDNSRCEKCHSYGKNVKMEFDFYKFTDPLPKEGFGNGVDWDKAEEMGLIKPVSYVEGISAKPQNLVIQKDFTIQASVEGLPGIIFSHKKHTVWSGCELCHPEIFMVKKGASKYSMPEIFDGKFCGVCHGFVAFPLTNCQRCHTQPVQ